MTQHPLLFFPTKENATRSKLQGRATELFLPSYKRQGDRLTPKFQALVDALQQKRINLQQTAAGIDPEEVLVFETRGAVEDFITAVNKFGGFEWLGEIDIEDMKSDDDFYEVDSKGNRKEGELTGRLYAVFTNQLAMRQLLELWKRWVKDGCIDTRKKEHKGKAPLIKVFESLYDIRKWDVQDRFAESEVLKYWEEDIHFNPERPVRFEIELWFRSNRFKQERALASIQKLVSEKGGRIISSAVIESIRYHGVLAELPAEEIQTVIHNQNTELVSCENIMFFRPSGQVAVSDRYHESELEQHEETADYPLPEGDPVVGILDGLPLVHHQVLKNRLIIDDPDNVEEYYQVSDRKHGTAMCSLIVRGDLSNNEEPISAPLYVRPIMRPDPHDRKFEFVLNDQLLIDVIHQAVKRIFENERDHEAVAPSVQVINLSLGDPDRLFYNSMSPWSRLLDWLSYKYRVLFIVSSGNYAKKIQLDLTPCYPLPTQP